MMSMRCWLWPLGLLVLSGCGLMVRHRIDKEIRDLSSQNDDGETIGSVVKSLPLPPSAMRSGTSPSSAFWTGQTAIASAPEQANSNRSSTVADLREAAKSELQQVAYNQKEQEPFAERQRLYIPKGLLGAEDADLRMEMPEDAKEAERYINNLYPPVPDLPPMPPPAPGPEGRPLTLADLQRLGELYSPAIKNAFAAIEAARAAAYQAGMYPNPTIAYEHDTVETGPAGYPGGYFDQLIKTGGKLTVQQAAATMDVLNARLALRKAKADMWTQVRTSYFAVLVALQGIRYNEAIFKFAEDLYEKHVVRVHTKLSPPYEPMQLRPLVLQARYQIIQARNAYAAAWHQLGAALGLPDLPPSQLAGGLDQPMPVYDYDAVTARLENHTDVRQAVVSVQKAKYNLQFQKLVPLPDVGARALVQKDYTTPPNQVVQSAVMYMTVPLWDQNRGGIRQAEWQLAQTSAGPSQARYNLITTLADAYNRYVTNRQQVEITLQQVRDLLRVYKAAWRRHQDAALEVSFSDLWPIQQTLIGLVGTYVVALGAYWQGTVDVANLLQTEDFFGSGQRQMVPELPVLEDLMTPLRDYPRAPIARKESRQHPETAWAQAASPPGSQQAAPTPQPPASAPSAPANAPAALPQLPAIPRRTETTAPEP